MTEAYIYDAVRSPRGKGRKDGSLHEVTPVDLAAQILAAIRDRNELDTSKVDDVVFGCLDTIGPQSGDIARTCGLVGGLPQHVPQGADHPPLLSLVAHLPQQVALFFQHPGLQHRHGQRDNRAG